ncbi:Beta-hexosaminidase [bacterium HR19]|nr:Beta-hexosaminidase [bacterium HR19]
MLGGFFIVAIKGKEADQETVDFLKTFKPSGVILFSYNIPDSVDELREFLYSLKGKVGYNFFFCVDEEGGRVMRIKTPFELPPARQIGEMYEKGMISDEDIFELGEKLGSFLASCGVDVNFAPVVDLYGYNFSVIGDRAFSSDPLTLGKIARAFAKGMKSGGVLPVAKHFPGHGLVLQDSHKELPVSYCDEEEIKKHILPFKMVSDDVYGIMTAHIVLKNLDSLPCTISRRCIAELKSFFRGCVITDDLTMDALKGFGSIGDVALLSFEAGCDAILICKPDYNLLADVFEKFSKDVKKRVSEGRIRDSVQRVAFLRFKRSFARKSSI